MIIYICICYKHILSYNFYSKCVRSWSKFLDIRSILSIPFKNLMSETDESSEHDSDGLPQYEVEAILRARQNHYGKIQYLVKWKRFSHKFDTWENEENLHCPELIKKYLTGEEEEEYEDSYSDDQSANEKSKKRGPKTKDLRLLIVPQNIPPPSKKIGPKIFYQNEKDKNKPQPKITDAYKNNDKIYFILTMPDGSIKELTSTIAKCKYPILVIDYLEANAHFDHR